MTDRHMPDLDDVPVLRVTGLELVGLATLGTMGEDGARIEDAVLMLAHAHPHDPITDAVVTDRCEVRVFALTPNALQHLNYLTMVGAHALVKWGESGEGKDVPGAVDEAVDWARAHVKLLVTEMEYATGVKSLDETPRPS